MIDKLKLVLDYILEILIWIDQGFNVLLGGKADETLSSRAYRADMDGKILGKFFRPLIDKLFFWQKEHCRVAYLSEIDRKQLPKNFLRWGNR